MEVVIQRNVIALINWLTKVQIVSQIIVPVPVKTMRHMSVVATSLCCFDVILCLLGKVLPFAFLS